MPLSAGEGKPEARATAVKDAREGSAPSFRPLPSLLTVSLRKGFPESRTQSLETKALPRDSP